MSDKEFVKEITRQADDFSQWYVDVILKADLADYAPVRGCMVMKPDGYEIWEAIQRGMDRRFKETGHRNAYFPLFIPESLLQKEKEHVEGFNPELPWVTEAGGEQLQERLAVRPTSETIICAMYAKWVQSYRDLPILWNQWANVVRWEKVTRPFLRTTEFLWQEGHTAHRTEEEAMEEVLRMLEVYRQSVEEDLAVPVVKGLKTEREKFAGAVRTYSIEGLMRDGKALQCGTSHHLGQNFSRVFDIQFLDADGQRKFVWQTSWGASTRLIGAVVMMHGDDRGLRLPPRVAPTQVVIVPIGSGQGLGAVLEEAASLRDRLRRAALRVMLDDRGEFRPGWKFNEWEMRGVPLRLEIGPRDLAKAQVTAVRRDTGAKLPLPISGLEAAVTALLDEIQAELFRQAKAFVDEHTAEAGSLDELSRIIEERRGFVWADWCGAGACEVEIKEKTGATARNIPFEQPANLGVCAVCGVPGKHRVLFARAY